MTQGEATDGGVSGRLVWVGEGEGQDWQVAEWAEQRGTKVSKEEEAEVRQRAGGEPLGRGTSGPASIPSLESRRPDHPGQCSGSSS